MKPQHNISLSTLSNDPLPPVVVMDEKVAAQLQASARLAVQLAQAVGRRIVCGAKIHYEVECNAELAVGIPTGSSSWASSWAKLAKVLGPTTVARIKGEV